jgi:uracil-DNA glycosylase
MGVSDSLAFPMLEPQDTVQTEMPVQTEMIVSALDWWADAGVDVLVEDEPRVWLAAKDLPAMALPSMSVVARNPAPTAMPSELPSFTDWLMQADILAECGPATNRVRPAGDPTAELMVIIDMPDLGDTTRGMLINGEAGELFDKMVAATHQVDGVERNRSTIYLASLLPGRTPSGTIDEAMLAQAVPIIRHHIGLIRPKKLWLMGQSVSRALLGASAAPGQARLQYVNHEGSNMAAVATHPPRFLLQQPKWKKGAWEDIKTLIKGTDA